MPGRRELRYGPLVIRQFHERPKQSWAELLIDIEEDELLRLRVVGLLEELREADTGGP